MKCLKGNEEIIALNFINIAKNIAINSSCKRSKCGSVMVSDSRIIGQGFNSPPANLEGQRKCLRNKGDYNFKVTDKTCCVHAEQRAIMDALKNNPKGLENSKIYFIRLDMKDKILFAGDPYCTICSKMALDTGIKNFVLYHLDGIIEYNAEEYNLLSYEYSE